MTPDKRIESGLGQLKSKIVDISYIIIGYLLQRRSKIQRENTFERKRNGVTWGISMVIFTLNLGSIHAYDTY